MAGGPNNKAGTAKDWGCCFSDRRVSRGRLSRGDAARANQRKPNSVFANVQCQIGSRTGTRAPRSNRKLAMVRRSYVLTHGAVQERFLEMTAWTRSCGRSFSATNGMLASPAASISFADRCSRKSELKRWRHPTRCYEGARRYCRAASGI